ncbi:GNAT family N-acetyltransferase [Providencia alcalifaciens]|uniref:GNAT family N-acetyltransferase n=1 Tax=Providencia TaxID=586 RepID=UPI00234AD225|nr:MULTISPECIES: GNAT family N-acetyltransferase [unclassified Providencia]
MNIKKIELTDFNEVKNFIINSDHDFTPSLSSRVNLAEYTTKLINNSVLFSISKNEVILALVACYANNHVEKIAYIPYIAVSKQYRGLGCSKLLLNYLIDYLINHEFRSVSLTVKKNSTAYNLYKKYGFMEKQEFIYSNTDILGCDMELTL